MKVPPVLEQISYHVTKKIKQTPFTWVRDSITQSDIEKIKTASEDSVFDPLKIRSSFFKMLEEGKANLFSRRGPFARVVVISTEQKPHIQWNLWANIFKAFGPPPPSCGPFWEVLLFASPLTREFPVRGMPIGAEHINGGYAIPSDSRSIVIYREEEASRVLVHELLHACGSDNHSFSVEIKESLTETWAELFLIAIQSNNSLKKIKNLWSIQSKWISDQNSILRNEYGVKDSSDYAWRYTLSREEALLKVGLSLPPPSIAPRATVGNSLRFTSPGLA